MHTTPEATQTQADFPGDPLDRALTTCLVAPALPAEFRARVMASVLAEQLQELTERRHQLEAEHAQELARLKRGHVLLKRDTLALVTASAFAAGACAQIAIPWLQLHLEFDSAMTAPLLALLIGMAAGASVWAERFGKPGPLFGLLRG
jgi:hypothetical protein